MIAPSLAMIPTGFKDGKLYSVLPESGVGDFTVTRGSGATRVNKNGLIEDVRILSGELVTNGDFSNGSTGWTLGADWSVVGGALNASATASTSYQVSTGIVAGKTYKVNYTISNYVSGSVRIELGSGNVSVGTIRSDNGTYTEYIVALGDDTIYFDGIIAFTGSIDNVSVKEVTTDTDIPRLDYTDGGCPVLLTEPQSTNLITYSEDFSDGSWSTYGTETSVTLDASQANPSGSNGSYIVEGVNGLRRFGTIISVTPSTDYTISFYVKNINATFLKILLTNSSVGNELFTSQVNTTDWSRVEINFTSGAGTSTTIQFLRDLPIGESIYIWGAQVEALSYSTSYIPTSGAIATRLADSVTGAGDSTTFNSTEGVLYAEINQNNDSFNTISLSNGTATNRVTIAYTSNSIRAIVTSNGVVTQITSSGYTQGENHRVGIRYDLYNFSLFIDGLLYANESKGLFSGSLSTLEFAQGNGGNPFYGKTKDLRVYNTALTDLELQELTTI